MRIPEPAGEEEVRGEIVLRRVVMQRLGRNEQEETMNTSVKNVVSHLKREVLYCCPPIQPRKILFDHVPKCGGSTLLVYLARHYPKRKIFTTNGANPSESVELFKEMAWEKRREYSFVNGHLANELFDYVDPACLKITVLRDPVERIISHYYYVKRTTNHYLYSTVCGSGISLEEYATSSLSDELQNWYTTHYAGVPTDVAVKKPEETVGKAVEVLLTRYDVVGFLDRFDLFMQTLRAKANLRCKYGDRRVNVTRDRPHYDSIPQSVIHKIEQVNSLDLDLYRRVREVVG